MRKSRILKRLFAMVLTVMVLIMAMPMMVSAATEADPVVIELIAGQTKDVGEVKVYDTATQIIVKFEIDVEGWWLTKTNVYIGATAPTKSAPGTFPYHHLNLMSKTDAFYINKSDYPGVTQFYIAAHADVIKPDFTSSGVNSTIDAINALLPLPGKFKVTSKNYTNGYSYSDGVVWDTGLGGIDGTYKAWCIDLDKNIYENTDYAADFYSSIDVAELPAGLVEYPDHLDSVNWLVNHRGGNTPEVIQSVIWKLIDDSTPPGTWTAAKEALYQSALINGDGYIPGFVANDIFTVIANPRTMVNGVARQPMLIELGAFQPWFTYTTDTAWALATDGIKWSTGWGSYFVYYTNPV